MPQADRRAGFTLIEVVFAIVLGVMLIGGATVLYQQVRESALNALAKEKLMAVTIVVEEQEARNYELPKLDQLRVAWKTKRPDDYNLSPWGGSSPFADTDFIEGEENVIANKEIGGSLEGELFNGTGPDDRGRIYYFRRKPSDPGRPYLWLPELSVFEPSDRNAVYRMSGYGVAYLGPKGEQWFFVEGRGKTNAPGTGKNELPPGQIEEF